MTSCTQQVHTSTRTPPPRTHLYTYAQCAHMLVHACTHVHMHTHTCPSSSRSPGRCALALPRPQLESTSALGPTVYAAPARTQSATGQERPCPLPGEGVEVPGPATTDTYRYSQDGRPGAGMVGGRAGKGMGAGLFRDREEQPPALCLPRSCRPWQSSFPFLRSKS